MMTLKNPFDHFDKIYFINLDSRPDRLERVMREFEKVGIADRVERVTGIVVNEFDNQKQNFCYGNHLSHAHCLELARASNAKNVLIFEDDVKFINNTSDVLEKAIDELPSFWDMLYLGANIERPAYQVRDHLAKLTFAYSTHAYAVNTATPVLISELIKINKDKTVMHNDVVYSDFIIPMYCCYVCVPIIAVQYESFSDIEQAYVNYDWMEERFNSNLVRK